MTTTGTVRERPAVLKVTDAASLPAEEADRNA